MAAGVDGRLGLLRARLREREQCTREQERGTAEEDRHAAHPIAMLRRQQVNLLAYFPAG
jgi:hypothetical protein